VLASEFSASWSPELPDSGKMKVRGGVQLWWRVNGSGMARGWEVYWRFNALKGGGQSRENVTAFWAVVDAFQS
jgi:hypothetical protein